jgi:hypothetical protein
MGNRYVQIHIFLTSALAGGEWSASCPGRFTPGKDSPVPSGQEAGWAPEPVWKTWRKFFTLPGLEVRPLGLAARSQSLYQLRYPAYQKKKKTTKVWNRNTKWSVKLIFTAKFGLQEGWDRGCSRQLHPHLCTYAIRTSTPYNNPRSLAGFLSGCDNK